MPEQPKIVPNLPLKIAQNQKTSGFPLDKHARIQMLDGSLRMQSLQLTKLLVLVGQ
jgi:hypothetical protein